MLTQPAICIHKLFYLGPLDAGPVGAECKSHPVSFAVAPGDWQ